MSVWSVLDRISVLCFLLFGTILSCLVYSIFTIFPTNGGDEASIGIELLRLFFTCALFSTYWFVFYGLVWFALLLFAVHRAFSDFSIGPVEAIIVGATWNVMFVLVNTVASDYFGGYHLNIVNGFAAFLVSLGFMVLVLFVRRRLV